MKPEKGGKPVNPYRELGVDSSADQDDIQRAYRRIAKQHHPDVSGCPDSSDTFRSATEAYETLSDPKKRAAFDDTTVRHRDTRSEPRMDQPARGVVDFAAILSPAEAATGGDWHAEIPLPVACPRCRGGFLALFCPTCLGSGVVEIPRPVRISIPPGVSDGESFVLRYSHGRIRLRITVIIRGGS